MWGGRFGEKTDALVQQFNASIDFDRRLARYDIAGSIAHARMLAERHILTAAEAEAIIAGLEAIRLDIEAERLHWRAELEDVHMNIEAELTRRIGPTGGKLHTARSRNDQVATDLRLYLREQTHRAVSDLLELRRVVVALAEAHLGVVMPGYTHLQVAQPVLYSHHLLAYYQMFARDQERFGDSLKRLNVSPLGAGALAGTTFDIDPERTAALLEFDEAASNSMDAVSDRDFVVEFLSNASLTMMHLSRLSEELTLWSTQEFGFITLPDSHATGSSIMPQKKNPDVPELVRGKTGRVYGQLMALLTTLKGLPLAYNKDLQEDKEALFDAVDTLQVCLAVTTDMLPRIEVNASRMREAAGRAYSNATDLADYLVRKGLPFRVAHEAVGKLVAQAARQGRTLESMTLAELQQVAEVIDDDVYQALDLDRIVNARNSHGGTSTAQVERQIARAKEEMSGDR